MLPDVMTAEEFTLEESPVYGGPRYTGTCKLGKSIFGMETGYVHPINLIVTKTNITLRKVKLNADFLTKVEHECLAVCRV
jgi:hypothetical protein